MKVSSLLYENKDMRDDKNRHEFLSLLSACEVLVDGNQENGKSCNARTPEGVLDRSTSPTLYCNSATNYDVPVLLSCRRAARLCTAFAFLAFEVHNALHRRAAMPVEW